MNRQEKQGLIENVNHLHKENKCVFIVSMNSVTAESAMSFRSKVRESEGYAKVIKNTLNKIALKNIGLESLNSRFSKQIVTIFTNNPIEIAKVLEEYKEKGYEVIVGSDKTSIFSPDDVKKLATIPPLPILRAMLLAAMLGVHTKTVRLLSEGPALVLRLLMANVNKTKQ